MKQNALSAEGVFDTLRLQDIHRRTNTASTEGKQSESHSCYQDSINHQYCKRNFENLIVRKKKRKLATNQKTDRRVILD